MIKNYEILKRENIYFGKDKLLEKITVKCYECGREFTMGRMMEDDKIDIEYTYCPHCANKLEVEI